MNSTSQEAFSAINQWRKGGVVLSCVRLCTFQVQGMSFIAAVLILNLEEADAFIAFANLLNKPCQMAFFRVDHDLVKHSHTSPDRNAASS